ncbi:hypothetical protein ACFXD5_04430, partial [Streptomyces sp. NPDC059385]
RSVCVSRGVGFVYTRELLRAATEGLTAAGAAEAAGISRITARRYLEHLVDTGRADRTPRYGQVGRPELHYRWLAASQASNV